MREGKGKGIHCLTWFLLGLCPSCKNNLWPLWKLQTIQLHTNRRTALYILPSFFFSCVSKQKLCSLCNLENFPLLHEHLSMSKHADAHPHFPKIVSGKFSNIQKNCKHFPVNTQKPTWVLPLLFCCFITFLLIGPSLCPSIKQFVSSVHYKMPTPLSNNADSTKCAW